MDTYLAAYGPALQVISENWGTRRQTANPDRPDDPFSIAPMDALAVARNEGNRLSAPSSSPAPTGKPSRMR